MTSAEVSDIIAQGMGYEYCILFPCAREAMRWYPGPILLPENVCPGVFQASRVKMLRPIDQQTGLADIPVHLYGYQARNSSEDPLSLDPLMTGWLRPLATKSAIISFGRKKLVSLNYGGAFLTKDRHLAEHMKKFAHWNDCYTTPLKNKLENLDSEINLRFRVIDTWDRFLGDFLTRVPKEQIIPWRVMRTAISWIEREEIVRQLREEHLPVGTNFAPIEGENEWGNTVLNFFCEPYTKTELIERTCEIIERVLIERVYRDDD